MSSRWYLISVISKVDEIDISNNKDTDKLDDDLEPEITNQ